MEGSGECVEGLEGVEGEDQGGEGDGGCVKGWRLCGGGGR